MGNLDMYNKYAQPPQNALKKFNNGSFSGTDINPMWRIRTLTEEYGECGFGWYVEIRKVWREDSSKTVCKLDNSIETITESTVYCEIALHVKREGEWSAPVIGVGGNTLAGYSKKKAEVIVSDESYKMAYTDALGNACKMLGIGANVWWECEPTKYTKPTVGSAKPDGETERYYCERCHAEFMPTPKRSAQQLAKASKDKFGQALCVKCANDQISRWEIEEINRQESLAAVYVHEDAGDRG